MRCAGSCCAHGPPERVTGQTLSLSQHCAGSDADIKAQVGGLLEHGLRMGRCKLMHHDCRGHSIVGSAEGENQFVSGLYGVTTKVTRNAGQIAEQFADQVPELFAAKHFSKSGQITNSDNHDGLRSSNAKHELLFLDVAQKTNANRMVNSNLAAMIKLIEALFDGMERKSGQSSIWIWQRMSIGEMVCAEIGEPIDRQQLACVESRKYAKFRYRCQFPIRKWAFFSAMGYD